MAHPNSREHMTVSRAINAQPWEPMRGMRKYQCEDCDFFFASKVATEKCPDCVERAKRVPKNKGRAGW